MTKNKVNSDELTSSFEIIKKWLCLVGRTTPADDDRADDPPKPSKLSCNLAIGTDTQPIARLHGSKHGLACNG
jgi:hypothetical protein